MMDMSSSPSLLSEHLLSRPARDDAAARHRHDLRESRRTPTAAVPARARWAASAIALLPGR